MEIYLEMLHLIVSYFDSWGNELLNSSFFK